MYQEIYFIDARIKVPDDIAEMGVKALEEKGNSGLLETLIKIVLHAMVDDVYYQDLKLVCAAAEEDPIDGKTANIRVTFASKYWECQMVGRTGQASILGRANIMADCHGMKLSEFLAQCIHCGPAVMMQHAKLPDANDFPDVFP